MISSGHYLPSHYPTPVLDPETEAKLRAEASAPEREAPSIDGMYINEYSMFPETYMSMIYLCKEHGTYSPYMECENGENKPQNNSIVYNLVNKGIFKFCKEKGKLKHAKYAVFSVELTEYGMGYLEWISNKSKELSSDSVGSQISKDHIAI